MSVNVAIVATPTGWIPSGQPANPQGTIGVDPVYGDLLSIPFETSQTNLDVTGSATASLQTGGIFSNSDGSGTAISVSVPAYNGTLQMVRIWFRFTGTSIGVRYLASTNPGFSCKIDGRAYKIPPVDLFLSSEQRTLVDAENHYPICKGLNPKIVHHGVFTFCSPPSGTTTFVVFGLTVDQGAGYMLLPRCVGLAASANLTTVLTNVNLGTAQNTAKGFVGIDYSNNDVSSVTLTSSSTTATGIVASNAGMVVGQPVVISGATQPEYNGTFAIASLISTTGFTYTFVGSSTSPATGTITAAWKYHLVTVNYNGVDAWTAWLGPKGGYDIPTLRVPPSTATYPPSPRGIIKLAGIAANFQHKADANFVVNAAVIGGY